MPDRTTHPKPRIAITLGDPCGVGPEVIVKAILSGDLTQRCTPLIVGDAPALRRAMKLLGAGLHLRMVQDASEIEAENRTDAVHVLSRWSLTEGDIPWGKPSEKACRSVVEAIETAVALAMRGDVDAICTCPIHKANLQKHGFPFPGHTELLRELTHAGEVVMMLAGPRLRVSLATIHHAISEVPSLLSREGLRRTIEITLAALERDFGIAGPRLAVAGLNPHAGEGGSFGREEIEIIGPVVESFAGASAAVSGPFPADTLFHRAYEGEFDAVVAMYHDQGLVPIKLVHFHDAVNVTLGLPIVRTSVDHGTAYDLAGTGKAHPGSLVAAIDLAVSMALNRKAAGR